MKFPRYLLLFLSTLALLILSVPLMGSPLTSSDNCGDSLNSYSQEDINVAVEFSYEKSVKEVVESLEIPYPKILQWIYQREKMQAEENGHKVKGSSSTTFLSSTYEIGVIGFALQVGINEVAKQVDINRRALIRLVDRIVRPVVEQARQEGAITDIEGIEALQALLRDDI